MFAPSASDSLHQPSPPASANTPLHGVTFKTPSDHGASPGHAITPAALAPSPMSAAVIRASKIEHTNLFLQGQFLEMAVKMEDEENGTLSHLAAISTMIDRALGLHRNGFTSFGSLPTVPPSTGPLTASSGQPLTLHLRITQISACILRPAPLRFWDTTTPTLATRQALL